MNKQLKSALGIGFFVVAMGVVYYSFRNSDPSDPPPPAPATPAEKQARRQQNQEAMARRAAEVKAKEQAIRDAKFAEVSAIRMAQFKELGEALSKPVQWRMLPSFIYEIGQEFNGNVWFTTSGLQYDHREHASLHFRNSVENFATSKTPLIHLGRLVLLDKSGRIWGFNEANQNVLQCFDPSTKQWTFRSVKGEANPSTTRQIYTEDGKFSRTAWEDEQRNIFFIAGAKEIGFNVHRFSRQGEWSTEALLPPGTKDEFLIDDARVALQPKGRVVLYPRRIDRFNRDELQVHYFDGAKWGPIRPFHCRNKKHDIEDIIPLPNGAIGSLCDGDAFWTYWPEGSVSRVSITEHVTKLDDPDPLVRQAAVAALTDLGPDQIEQIRSLEGELVSPGGRQQLAAVIQHLASVTNDDHENVIYGGRFVINQIYYISQSAKGQLRFYTDHCRDLAVNETRHDCLLTFDVNGKWTNQPLKQEDLTRAGMGKIPHREFEDSRGDIWLPSGRRMSTADGSVAMVAPDGLTIGEPTVEDSAGRIYFMSTRSSRSHAVFDPRAVEGAPLLPQVDHHAIHPVIISGERQGWALNGMVHPHQVFRFGARSDIEPLSVSWDKDSGIGYLMPLKNGVLVATYNSNYSFHLWDGRKWLLGQGAFRDAVHANAPRLSELVGHEFEGYGQHEPNQHLASDGRGGLWMSLRGYEHTDKLIAGQFFEQVFFHRFEYFDGKQWHDVWKEVGWEMPGNGSADRPLCAVEGGDTVLYSCKPPNAEMSDRVLYRFRFNRAAAKVEVERIGSTTEPMEVKETPQIAKDTSRESWMSWHKYMLHFSDGHFEALPSTYPRLRFIDSAGRKWYRIGDKLKVAQGDLSIEFPDKYSQVLETTDGRIFLVSNSEIREVGITLDGQQLKMNELANYPWPTQRNAIDAFFIDANDGLWIDGSGPKIVRIQLPQESQPAR